MDSLVKVFVNRFALSICVFASVLIFGLVSIRGIGVDLYPSLSVPYVSVVTVYPGAGSQEIDRQVTQPLERAIASLPGLRNVTSTSSEGFSTVVAQFSASVDLGQATTDVSGRVDSVSGDLPRGARRPVVSKYDLNDAPILSVSLNAPGVPLAELQTFAEDTLRRNLRVDGVAQVSVIGPYQRQVQVLLNPAQLRNYGLVAEQVISAITNSALDLPIGTLDATHREGQSRILLTARNAPESTSDLESILIDPNGRVRLSDVATIRDASSSIDSYARVNGEPVILLSIRKTSEANSVAIADGVAERLASLDLPSGYEITIVSDTTSYTRQTVNDTLGELRFAVVAVALVIMLFVGRLGTVLAVVLSIPISIAGAFILFGVQGYTFNLITLLAITIAVGLVVDDSIVVSESIDKYQAQGMSRKEAVFKGTSAVSVANLAATLSLLAVFLPISFLPGIIGQFFAQFGLSMAVMVFCSYMASIFFLTMLMAYIPNALPPNWGDVARAARAAREDFTWSLRALKRI